MFAIPPSEVCHIGTVHFPSSEPPHPDKFARMRRAGFTFTPKKRTESDHWAFFLSHPNLGEAEMRCLRNLPTPPMDMIASSTTLTRRDKELAAAAGQGVSVALTSSRGSVLRDRKSLLKILRVAMTNDAVIAADHGSQIFWSKDALDDVLAVPGEPDVSVLYTIHGVHEDERQPGSETNPIVWIHTHGLGTVGAFDIDILRPSASLVEYAEEVLRAAALAAIDGSMKLDMPAYQLASPGDPVSPIAATTFLRAARSADRDILQHDDDELEDRAVLCDPRSTLSRLTGSVRPSTFLSKIDCEATTVRHSYDASESMASRARATLPIFRRIAEEFAKYKFPASVKLKYETDANDGSAEHLWFKFHGFNEDGSIDATLANSPHNIASMREGQRGAHSVERLSEWLINTPVGRITPTSRVAYRRLRENPQVLERFLKFLQEIGEAES